MRIETVTVSFLEMTDPSHFQPKEVAHTGLEIRQSEIPLPELNRFLYTAVGAQWYWIDRLCWSYEQWLNWLSKPTVQTWVLYQNGTPAGYFELEKYTRDDISIVYFGLVPRFTKKGLGGYLLTAAIERAWAMGARRIKLNTCSLDHPNALKNYLARGFRVYREIVEQRALPEQPLGPWPGPK